jgi:hypothetical protein
MQPVQLGSGQAALPAEWRVVLSAGARKLVVTLFILGAIGYVAYIGFVANNISRLNSDTERNNAEIYASQAFQLLGQQLQSATKQLQTCEEGSTQDSVPCRQTFDQASGVALGNFSGNLETITFPSDVAAEADAAESAASAAGNAFVAVSSQTEGDSPAAYQQVYESLGIEEKGHAVVSTFRSLQEALVHS